MKQSSIRLADGRELIYFDETDDRSRAAVDQRDLPAPPAPTQLRFDPLTEEWIAIAGSRQGRPMLPPSTECPLCPSTPGNLTEIPADDYDVVVFENRFPSFSTAAAAAHPAAASGPADYPQVRPGEGRCEVVCFTPEHDSSFGSLGESRVRLVLDALAQRTAELSAHPGVEQVFCFENRGVEIGVTLHHPHGQIYAYPYVTPKTERYLAAARKHRERTGRNLYADVLAAELAAGERVIAENEHWVAFVPAAARWPFEVHVALRRQAADLAELTEQERAAAAPLWLAVVRAFDALFDTADRTSGGSGEPSPADRTSGGSGEPSPADRTSGGSGEPSPAMPYIAAWHQAPVRVDRDLGYLHLQIFSIRRAPGKLKYLASSESAMGAFVNDIAPEDAATALRAALARD